MEDNSLWRMFCETGEPFCYLLYRSVVKERENDPNFPPGDNFAFSGERKYPQIRF